MAVGFFGNDGPGWSDHWLGDEITPAQSGTARFTANTGACDQLFQAGWLGADGSKILEEPISIDICAASNVYLDDNDIYHD